MPLEITDFPLVWMRYDTGQDHSHDEDFAALETCLKRGAPFVILTDNAPTEPHAHSQDEKKRTVLWMKAHKAELRSRVLAMIVIEPSAATRLLFKSFGVAFSKFWGYPLRLAPSREGAMEIATTLLAERAASAPSGHA
ncbi:hypothetical protein [Phaeobacter sp. HF9A]|uniref:hypothetical protein n=1 Tax=Phaeobacter sp. HF9A TaxID=2721561 RepID=UPI0014311902|nr:hypothetical protein [Phaeobacter sp. HF9A]NIZ13672.1 hypothetical protein [Phaeobacter sp. HF9A]